MKAYPSINKIVNSLNDYLIKVKYYRFVEHSFQIYQD